MTCNKCGSDENLSIKARHRDGRIRIMLCRTCRNKDAQTYIRQPKEKLSNQDHWNLRALESHQRILARFV
jgi:protein-arginine kinase activator protein McsA